MPDDDNKEQLENDLQEKLQGILSSMDVAQVWFNTFIRSFCEDFYEGEVHALVEKKFEDLAASLLGAEISFAPRKPHHLSTGGPVSSKTISSIGRPKEFDARIDLPPLCLQSQIVSDWSFLPFTLSMMEYNSTSWDDNMTKLRTGDCANLMFRFQVFPDVFGNPMFPPLNGVWAYGHMDEDDTENQLNEIRGFVPLDRVLGLRQEKGSGRWPGILTWADTTITYIRDSIKEFENPHDVSIVPPRFNTRK